MGEHVVTATPVASVGGSVRGRPGVAERRCLPARIHLHRGLVVGLTWLHPQPPRCAKLATVWHE